MENTKILTLKNIIMMHYDKQITRSFNNEFSKKNALRNIVLHWYVLKLKDQMQMNYLIKKKILNQ